LLRSMGATIGLPAEKKWLSAMNERMQCDG
jgi:hypothetical protein